jgi:hypothetical protein
MPEAGRQQMKQEATQELIDSDHRRTLRADYAAVLTLLGVPYEACEKIAV